MPRHFRDYKPTDRIYTFVDPLTNENTNIDSEALRLWCAEHAGELEVFNTPCHQAMADRFFQTKAVDLFHVFEVCEMTQLDPIIYLKTGTFGANGGPDVLLADGHHRYVAAVMCGLQFIPSYLLEPEQWHEFLIEGMPQITAEELLARRPAPGGPRK